MTKHEVGLNTRRTSDLKFPTRSDGERDERYKQPQFTNKDGSRDKRTTPTRLRK